MTEAGHQSGTEEAMPGAPGEQEQPESHVGPTVNPPVGVPTSVESAPPPLTEGSDRSTDKDDEGKVFELRSQDFRKIKDKAREQGKRAALAEIADKFKAAGVGDLDEAARLLAALKNSQNRPQTMRNTEEREMPETKSKTTARQPQKPQQQQRAQQPKRTHRSARRLEAERARLASEKDMILKKWRAEERRRRDLQRQLDAKDAEMQLREVAIQNGVRDVDYAIRLLTRELRGKKAADLESFDEAAFFQGLRNDRPYLFGEYQTPANTGNGTEEAPPEPDASEVTTAAADGGQFDARSASREDYEKRLRQLGLNVQM